MAFDIRRICFGEAQVLAALRGYAVRRKGTAEALRTIKLETGPDGVRARAFRSLGHSTPLMVAQQDDLIKALVMYCLDERIAIPVRGIKTIELVGGHLALFIHRMFAHATHLQDLTATGRSESEHLADEDQHIWQSGGAAEPSDVRVILLSLREIHLAVADYLGQISSHRQLGPFDDLTLAAGTEGVFASVALTEKQCADRRILSPDDLLDAVVSFCRSKQIALPAHVPKRLAVITADRLALIIPQRRHSGVVQKYASGAACAV